MLVCTRIKLYLTEINIKQLSVGKGKGIEREKRCQSFNGKRKLNVEEFEKTIECLGVTADTFLTPSKPESSNPDLPLQSA